MAQAVAVRTVTDAIRLFGFPPELLADHAAALDTLVAAAREPAVRVQVENAFTMPQPPLPPPGDGAAAGRQFAVPVTDADGFTLPVALRNDAAADHLAPWIDPATRPRTALFLDEAVYGGMIFAQFGHNLLEMLARLGEEDIGGDRPILFHPVTLEIGQQASTQALMQPLFEAAGHAWKRIRLVDRPLEIRRLVIPQPRLVINRRLRAGYHAPFARIVAGLSRAERGSRRVFLSRSGLGPGISRRRPSNAAELDDLMRALGFDVVWPERLPIHAQVALVGDAEVIAGMDGSALHLALFARPGTLTLCLDTRMVINQLLVEHAAALRGRHLWVGSSGAGVPPLDLAAIGDWMRAHLAAAA